VPFPPNHTTASRLKKALLMQEKKFSELKAPIFSKRNLSYVSGNQSPDVPNLAT
jgi:hypothetical protein